MQKVHGKLVKGAYIEENSVTVGITIISIYSIKSLGKLNVTN